MRFFTRVCVVNYSFCIHHEDVCHAFSKWYICTNKIKYSHSGSSVNQLVIKYKLYLNRERKIIFARSLIKNKLYISREGKIILTQPVIKNKLYISREGKIIKTHLTHSRVYISETLLKRKTLTQEMHCEELMVTWSY